jgi:hypothetical protein
MPAEGQPGKLRAAREPLELIFLSLRDMFLVSWSLCYGGAATYGITAMRAGGKGKKACGTVSTTPTRRIPCGIVR